MDQAMPAAFRVLFSQTSTVRICYRVIELSLGANVMCLRFCVSTRLASTACHKEWPHIFLQVEAYTCVLMSQGKIACSSMCLRFATELEPIMLLLIYNIITKKRIYPEGNLCSFGQ